jgi:hypothetical protein
MTAEKWVKAMAATARRQSEWHEQRAADRARDAGERQTSNAYATAYKGIADELSDRLAQGFDDPAAEQVAWTAEACGKLAKDYRTAEQAMRALLKGAPEGFDAEIFELMGNMWGSTAQMFEDMADTSTPEKRVKAERMIAVVQSGNDIFRQMARLDRLGDSPVQ